MGNNEFLPAAPASCTTAGEVPAVSELCLTDLGIEGGEITDIILCEKSSGNPLIPSNPITGWVNTGLAANAKINEAVITTWFAGIDNNAGNIVHFEVAGDKPAAQFQSVTEAKGRTINLGDPNRSINISVYNKTNLNYAFWQKLQRGWSGFMWYCTDKYIYGGKNGIITSVINADDLLERGQNTLSALTATFQFKSGTSMPRDFKPFL